MEDIGKNVVQFYTLFLKCYHKQKQNKTKQKNKQNNNNNNNNNYTPKTRLPGSVLNALCIIILKERSCSPFMCLDSASVSLACFWRLVVHKQIKKTAALRWTKGTEMFKF